MKKTLIALLLVFSVLFSALGALASDTAEQSLPFATFGDAVKAAGEEAVKGGTSEYMAVIVKHDGRYYRVVSYLDDQAKALDDAISTAEDIDAAFDAFNAYVDTLPVSFSEAFIAQPKAQEELDALVGKTIAELEAQGYTTSSYGTAGEADRIGFWMADGLYEYEMIVDADEKTYEQKNESDELGTMVVKSAKYFGIAQMATNLNVHMDGTIEPQQDPFEQAAPWVTKIFEAFQALQNGEKVDLDAFLQSLTEENPEAAEAITQFVAFYQQLYQSSLEQNLAGQE